MQKKKIGIYGGTFNPPHVGHLGAARAFFDKMCLDKLIVIPSFIPPHKLADNKTTAQQRVEMTRLAFFDFVGAEVSDIEIQRGGKSYTYLTLEALSSEDCELYMLIGTDMFLTLEEWHYPERIFELATVCYVRRENDKELGIRIEERKKYYETVYGARIFEIPLPVTELSSTDVREKVKNNTDVSDAVTESVLSYILSEGLYK